MGLVFIGAAYAFRFTRLALVLLVIHYLSEAVFHLCRILAYSEKTSVSNKLFKLNDLLFVLARFASVILSVLTFWFGLEFWELRAFRILLARVQMNIIARYRSFCL